MSKQKDSDQSYSNHKQACSAKLNQPEFGANAPLIGSVCQVYAVRFERKTVVRCHWQEIGSRIVLQRAIILGGKEPPLGECRKSLDDSDIKVITCRLRLTANICEIIARHSNHDTTLKVLSR